MEQVQEDTTLPNPLETPIEELTGEETQQPGIDWRAEAIDFIQRMPEGTIKLLESRTNLVPGSMETASMLLGSIVPNDRYEVNVLAAGFGIGSLAALLLHDERMIEYPQLAKDIALHHATAAFVVLTESFEAEQAAREARDAEEQVTSEG